MLEGTHLQQGLRDFKREKRRYLRERNKEKLGLNNKTKCVRAYIYGPLPNLIKFSDPRLSEEKYNKYFFWWRNCPSRSCSRN